MSASVTSMHAFAARRAAKSDQQIARDRVAERLSGKMPADRIHMAKERAANAITSRSVSIERAVKAAIAWALCSTDNDPTPPQAA